MASTYKDRELDRSNGGGGRSTNLGQVIGNTVNGGGNIGSTLYAGTGGTQGSYQERLRALSQDGATAYQPGDSVMSARSYLDQVIASKPGSYEGKYTSQVEELYNRIMNRQAFSYSMNEDAMYQMYAQRYRQQGERDLRDTMGQATANTGGYGNSYAQTAGQSAYGSAINSLRERIPELQAQAVSRYNDETERIANLYETASAAEQTDYARHQDQVSQWQDERSYAATRADAEYDRDYAAYRQQLQTAQSLLEYEREDQKTDTTSAQTLALQMIKAGIAPSDELVGRTGWDPEDVRRLLEKYQ